MSQNDEEVTVHYVEPRGVPNWLPAILPHIRECHGSAPQSYDENEECEALLSGRVSLWLAVRNGVLVGHLTTSIYRAGGSNYVHLPHLWSAPGERRVIESFVPQIVAYAQSVSAKGITYRTGRNAMAFARRLKKVGMKPALVEFFMAVPEAA